MRTFILLFAAFAFAACAESTPEDPKAAPNEAAEVSTPEFNLFRHRTRHDRG